MVNLFICIAIYAVPLLPLVASDTSTFGYGGGGMVDYGDEASAMARTAAKKAQDDMAERTSDFSAVILQNRQKDPLEVDWIDFQSPVRRGKPTALSSMTDIYTQAAKSLAAAFNPDTKAEPKEAEIGSAVAAPTLMTLPVVSQPATPALQWALETQAPTTGLDPKHQQLQTTVALVYSLYRGRNYNTANASLSNPALTQAVSILEKAAYNNRPSPNVVVNLDKPPLTARQLAVIRGAAHDPTLDLSSDEVVSFANAPALEAMAGKPMQLRQPEAANGEFTNLASAAVGVPGLKLMSMSKLSDSFRFAIEKMKAYDPTTLLRIMKYFDPLIMKIQLPLIIFYAAMLYQHPTCVALQNQWTTGKMFLAALKAKLHMYEDDDLMELEDVEMYREWIKENYPKLEFFNNFWDLRLQETLWKRTVMGMMPINRLSLYRDLMKLEIMRLNQKMLKGMKKKFADELKDKAVTATDKAARDMIVKQYDLLDRYQKLSAVKCALDMHFRKYQWDVIIPQMFRKFMLKARWLIAENRKFLYMLHEYLISSNKLVHPFPAANWPYFKLAPYSHDHPQWNVWVPGRNGPTSVPYSDIYPWSAGKGQLNTGLADGVRDDLYNIKDQLPLLHKPDGVWQPVNPAQEYAMMDQRAEGIDHLESNEVYQDPPIMGTTDHDKVEERDPVRQKNPPPQYVHPNPPKNPYYSGYSGQYEPEASPAPHTNGKLMWNDGAAIGGSTNFNIQGAPNNVPWSGMEKMMDAGMRSAFGQDVMGANTLSLMSHHEHQLHLTKKQMEKGREALEQDLFGSARPATKKPVVAATPLPAVKWWPTGLGATDPFTKASESKSINAKPAEWDFKFLETEETESPPNMGAVSFGGNAKTGDMRKYMRDLFSEAKTEGLPTLERNEAPNHITGSKYGWTQTDGLPAANPAGVNPPPPMSPRDNMPESAKHIAWSGMGGFNSPPFAAMGYYVKQGNWLMGIDDLSFNPETSGNGPPPNEMATTREEAIKQRVHVSAAAQRAWLAYLDFGLRPCNYVEVIGYFNVQLRVFGMDLWIMWNVIELYKHEKSFSKSSLEFVYDDVIEFSKENVHCYILLKMLYMGHMYTKWLIEKRLRMLYTLDLEMSLAIDNLDAKGLAHRSRMFWYFVMPSWCWLVNWKTNLENVIDLVRGHRIEVGRLIWNWTFKTYKTKRYASIVIEDLHDLDAGEIDDGMGMGGDD